MGDLSHVVAVMEERPEAGTFPKATLGDPMP